MSEEKEAGMQETLGVRVSLAYIKAIEKLISTGVYSSKGEVVREGLRRIFAEHGINLLELE